MGFVVSEFFSSHPILSPILSVLLVVSLLSLLNRIGLFQPLVSFVLRSLVALRDAIVSVSRFLWRALANGWFVLVESVFSPLLVHFLRPIAVTARRCLSTFLELVLTAVVLMARAAKASWTFLTLYIGRLFRWMYLNAISPAARMIRAVAFMIRDFTALAYRKLVVPSGNALSNLGSFCYNRGVLPVAYGCLYVYRHVIIASFLAVGRFLKWFYLRVVVPCALILWEALCTGWRYFRSGSTKAAYGVGKFLKWFYLRVVVPCARIIWEALCTGWQYFWNGSVKAAYSAGSALASAYRFSKRIFFELVALARKFYVRVLRPVLHLLDYVVVSPTAHFVDYVFVAPTFYVLRNYVSPFFRWIFRNLVVPVVFLVWEALAAAPMLSFRCFGLWLVATSSVDVELISIRQIGKNVLMSSLGFWIAGSSFRSGAGTRLAMYVLVQAVLSRSPFVSTAFIFLFVVVVNFSTRSSTYNPSRVSFAYLLLYHGVLFAANTRSMFHVLAAYSCVVVACSVAVFPPPFLARKLFFFLDFGIVSFFVDRSTGGFSRWLLRKLFQMRLWMFHMGTLLKTIFGPFYQMASKMVLLVWRYPLLGVIFVIGVGIMVAFLDSQGVTLPNVPWLSPMNLIRKISIWAAFNAVASYLRGDSSVFSSSILAGLFWVVHLITSVAARQRFMAKVYQDKIDVSARDAALTLMCIHRFRRAEMGRLGILHRDTIREIAKYVYASRVEDNRVWVRTLVYKH